MATRVRSCGSISPIVSLVLLCVGASTSTALGSASHVKDAAAIPSGAYAGTRDDRAGGSQTHGFGRHAGRQLQGKMRHRMPTQYFQLSAVSSWTRVITACCEVILVVPCVMEPTSTLTSL